MNWQLLLDNASCGKYQFLPVDCKRMESFVQAQDQNFLSNTEKIQRELEDEGLSKMLKTNFNLPNCLY